MNHVWTAGDSGAQMMWREDRLNETSLEIVHDGRSIKLAKHNQGLSVQIGDEVCTCSSDDARVITEWLTDVLAGRE